MHWKWLGVIKQLTGGEAQFRCDLAPRTPVAPTTTIMRLCVFLTKMDTYAYNGKGLLYSVQQDHMACVFFPNSDLQGVRPD